MKAGAFKNEEVAALQNAEFVSLSVDVDTDSALLSEHEVKFIPYIVVLDGEGKTVASDGGAREPEAYLKFLRDALAKTGPPRERVEAYLRTLGPVSDALRKKIAGLIDRLGADAAEDREAATAALQKLGEPALCTLLILQTADPEVQARVRSVIKSLEPMHKHVFARGLDRDVPALLAAKADARLREILPDAAHDDPAAWWKTHGEQARWNGKTYE